MNDEYAALIVASNRGKFVPSALFANDVSKMEGGASLFEYIVVMVCLGFSVYGALIYFQPNAANFHNEMKTGMSTSYPENYVGALTPAPTSVPTSVPTAPVAD